MSSPTSAPDIDSSPPNHSRRLAELFVLFIITIIFLRIIVIEPYGIPTGSMAPTLLGNHKQMFCPRCGHRIEIGDSAADLHSFCVNCGITALDYDSAKPILGDRVMVNKTLYFFRNPHRWEVAVFQCPSDYSKPYVKRVIGLPGESVQIRDGDIFINGELCRKSQEEALACSIPVWDYRFAPSLIGWSENFKIGPEKAFVLEPTQIRIEAAQLSQPSWIAYQNWSSENRRQEPILDLLPYNNSSRAISGQTVSDFLLKGKLMTEQDTGRFAIELTDGEARLQIDIEFHPEGSFIRLWNGKKLIREARCNAFRPNKPRSWVFSLVDRRASFSLDGSEWFPHYDLPAASQRKGVAEPFRFMAQGFNGAVSDLQLFRDIFYRDSGIHGVDKPFRLKDREYFMLGDNSQNSDDSRTWPIAGVPERNFLGKPFLLHQPSRMTHLSVGSSNYQFPSVDWNRIHWIH